MLKKYQVRKIVYEERELEYHDLLTQAQAAAVLGVSIQGVQSVLDSGRLTLVIDPTAHRQQGKRLVLRRELEDYKRTRKRRAV